MIRIGVLLFAISMFAGYVVHSQLQQNRKIAPSSKLLILDQQPVSGSTPGLLNLATNAAVKLAKPRPASSSSPAARPKDASRFFPGSKSAPVFTPEELETLQQSSVTLPSSKSEQPFELKTPLLQPNQATNQTGTNGSFKKTVAESGGR